MRRRDDGIDEVVRDRVTAVEEVRPRHAAMRLPQYDDVTQLRIASEPARGRARAGKAGHDGRKRTIRYRGLRQHDRRITRRQQVVELVFGGEGRQWCDDGTRE